MALPSIAKCQHYHLFGGSEAASVANRVPGGPALNVIGTGNTYSPSYVSCTGNSGFVTPGTSSLFNRAMILVHADSYFTRPTPTVPTASPASPTNTSYVAGANGYNGGIYPSGGGGMTARFGDSGAYDLILAFRGQDNTIFFPDGQIRIGQFSFLALNADDITGKLYVQADGRVGTASRSIAGHPVAADRATYIGNTASAGIVMPFAAFACFTSAFSSDQEMYDNMSEMAKDIEAGGVINFSPFAKV